MLTESIAIASYNFTPVVGRRRVIAVVWSFGFAWIEGWYLAIGGSETVGDSGTAGSSGIFGGLGAAWLSTLRLCGGRAPRARELSDILDEGASTIDKKEMLSEASLT